eukprot:CAMPEP_0205861964 /NCGR_PEP_ID=MMETSP1083-20121108/6055_1 /ASSEMBLY_ACC=CAM_ASM_000430 /TAXON_ID=97485 /ORGANISM="Prymnesium parvum, Strain Texoma1" /LENGTH=136 /DNA_ID=CAMNT_0053223713 /DNA_START=221 /DNA_END=632 /DNA_ORIENTATION=+
MAEASPAPPPAAAAAEALEETTPLPQIEPLPALHPPLHQMLEQLQQHLALPADLLPPALVDEAARLLAVAPHGSLLLRAQACHAALFGDPSAPPLVRGAPIAVAVGGGSARLSSARAAAARRGGGGGGGAADAPFA